MITQKQAAIILTKINLHHGNMPIDEFAVATFQEEINPTATFEECREAVREFYANNSDDKWLTAGKINAIIAQRRAKNKPSEAQIDDERYQMEQNMGRLLSVGEFWWYRRARRSGLSRRESATAMLNPRSAERERIAIRPMFSAGERGGLGQIGSAVGGFSRRQIGG